MDSKLFNNLLLLLGFVSMMPLPVAAAQKTSKDMVSTLFNSGYTAMSMTLALSLRALVPNHNSTTNITIFCPRDQAFNTLEDSPQPPLSLLQYHVVPRKLDSDFLLHSSILPFEFKFDTLLRGHPLVLTMLPGGGGPASTSINGVKITDWDIYSDGLVTVHGVEDFFDPTFETVHQLCMA